MICAGETLISRNTVIKFTVYFLFDVVAITVFAE